MSKIELESIITAQLVLEVIQKEAQARIIAQNKKAASDILERIMKNLSPGISSVVIGRKG